MYSDINSDHSSYVEAIHCLWSSDVTGKTNVHLMSVISKKVAQRSLMGASYDWVLG